MAVTKIWAVHDSMSRVLDYCNNPEKTKMSDLEQVLLYTANKDKTLDDSETSYAVTGVNCHADTAAREMEAVQRRFGKGGGNIAYHAYQSFKPGEVSAEECHKIGVELARRLWGDNYQVLVATHFNTGTYHNHFVVNSVGMWDGRKIEAKKALYYRMREESDRLCKEHGLSVLNDPQQHKTARGTYFAEKNGDPTRYNLMREALDKALTMASSWTELKTVMRKLGYVVEGDAYHKYVTIRSIHSKKRMRTFRLGEKYDKDALVDLMVENQMDLSCMERFYDFMEPYEKEYRDRNPPAEDYYRRRDFYSKAYKATGYLTLFRCFAIVLGIEPLYEKQYQKPLSAECREACRRLERYTAELDLVARERFEKPQDIQRFITDVNAQMEELDYARSKIRNKQRNCKDPEEKAVLKEECTRLSDELAKLRREKKTAYAIIEDNLKIRELLECEYEARLENDPYLSEREKNTIRNSKHKEDKDIERET